VVESAKGEVKGSSERGVVKVGRLRFFCANVRNFRRLQIMHRIFKNTQVEIPKMWLRAQKVRSKVRSYLGFVQEKDYCS
jgi:hypothetical protein